MGLPPGWLLKNHGCLLLSTGRVGRTHNHVGGRASERTGLQASRWGPPHGLRYARSSQHEACKRGAGKPALAAARRGQGDRSVSERISGPLRNPWLCRTNTAEGHLPYYHATSATPVCCKAVGVVLNTPPHPLFPSSSSASGPYLFPPLQLWMHQAFLTQVSFEEIPTEENGLDVFELESVPGKGVATIRG